MTDRLSDTPPFKIGNIEFRCWIVGDGANELGLPAVKFEWRSFDGRCVACRTGRATYVASVYGRNLRNEFGSLGAAMTASTIALNTPARKAG